VILYLPTGPVAEDSCIVDDDQIIAALSAASNATVVRVNYRLGNGIRYPTPVHDVLAGFDWVKQNLSTAKTPSIRHRRPLSSVSRYGVCGQLLGGSLATAIALTESRMGESRIAAAAVSNPIVDWIFPETENPEMGGGIEDGSGDPIEHSLRSMEALLRKPSPSKAKKTSWELYKDVIPLPSSSLLTARRQFFRKPANYFDSFASPILFFRSPGADVPPDKNVFHEDGVVDTAATGKRRKVPRVFPPTGAALKLPNMRISLGEETPLYDQGEELVKLLRRSIIRARQGRAGNRSLLDSFEEEDLDETEKTAIALKEAERRIEFHMPSRTGIWGTGDDPGWRNDVVDAGIWFRRVLG
jgi:acetyl esterase/lipase